MKLLLSMLLIVISTLVVNGQNVGIGTATPDGSAALEIESTTKGFLPPRMNTTQRTNIISPVAGLLVYDTQTDSYWYYDGSGWAELANGGAGATTYKVGDWAQGGVVAWVDETKEHGFSVCTNRVDNGLWSAGTTGLTRSVGDGIYAGHLNTPIIIAANIGFGDNGEKFAARQCNEYRTSSHGQGIDQSDWYLPSKKELQILYDNRVVIDSTMAVHGKTGLGEHNYTNWSSTEYNATKAWTHRMQTDHVGTADKEGANGNKDVRCVRKF